MSENHDGHLQALKRGSEEQLLRTDKVKADEYRQQLNSLLVEVARILDKAHAEGIAIAFNMSMDGFGRRRFDLQVSKPL